jgi:hypothetical protein
MTASATYAHLLQPAINHAPTMSEIDATKHSLYESIRKNACLLSLKVSNHELAAEAFTLGREIAESLVHHARDPETMSNDSPLGSMQAFIGLLRILLIYIRLRTNQGYPWRCSLSSTKSSLVLV